MGMGIVIGIPEGLEPSTSESVTKGMMGGSRLMANEREMFLLTWVDSGEIMQVEDEE